MGMFHGHNKLKTDTSLCLKNYGYLYNYKIGADYRDYDNLITDLYVPSYIEFDLMIAYLGGNSVAGGKLKSTSACWNDDNIGATNEVNFNALPSGSRNHYNGDFNAINIGSYFWSSSANGSDVATSYSIYYNSSQINKEAHNIMLNGYNIRCMRALTTQEQLDFNDGDIIETKTDFDGNSYNVVRIGTQGWTNSNLKTTHNLSGSVLNYVTDSSTWIEYNNVGYCAYNNDLSNV